MGSDATSLATDMTLNDDVGRDPGDAPEIEVGDNELLNDDEPHSQSRPSSTGILPARAKAALEAGLASDKALRDLLRTAQFLTATVQGACDRSRDFVQELESLDGTLEQQAADRRALLARVNELEQELAETRASFERERQFLASEQDAFIHTLVSEHEQAQKKLTDRLADLERELAAAREEREEKAAG
jgi:chromosome segregation ATPase